MDQFKCRQDVSRRWASGSNLPGSRYQRDEPRENHLLAALPDEIWLAWKPYLQEVNLPAGTALNEVGEDLRYVYFPTTCSISLLSMSENGDSTEIASTGAEGVVGVEVFLGGATSSKRAVVQTGGRSYRATAGWMLQEFSKGGPAMHLLLRFTQALFSQISQTAACNRHHSIEQRLCLWLLTTLDRYERTDLAVTQESIAGRLGVRREGITEAANTLRHAGAIECRRGHIRVLSRRMLEQRTCECYEVVKREYDRLLPDRVAT